MVLDVCGFSRFAEAWLTERRTSVDDLARFWEHAVAPQIDLLLSEGFEVGGCFGDGALVWRPARAVARRLEVARLLRELEWRFARIAPGLSLRTAADRGDLVFAEAQVGSQLLRWASGFGLEGLHRTLAVTARQSAKSSPGLQLRARNMELSAVWETTGAEVRPMTSLFVCIPARRWIWSDAQRVGALLNRIGTALDAHEVRLEAITHDDKGLLLRCAAYPGTTDGLLAAADAAALVLAATEGEPVGVAVAEDIVYRGPVRLGRTWVQTVHGRGVNLAAKTAASVDGLVIVALADSPYAEALRQRGLAPGEGLWRPTVRSGAATGSRFAPPPACLYPASLGRMHGREEVLAQLRRARAETLASRSRVVMIEGPPVCGKSALAIAFAVEIDTVAVGRCRPNGDLRAPWPEIVRQLCERLSASCLIDELSRALTQAGVPKSCWGVIATFGLSAFETDGP